MIPVPSPLDEIEGAVSRSALWVDYYCYVHQSPLVVLPFPFRCLGVWVFFVLVVQKGRFLASEIASLLNMGPSWWVHPSWLPLSVPSQVKLWRGETPVHIGPICLGVQDGIIITSVFEEAVQRTEALLLIPKYNPGRLFPDFPTFFLYQCSLIVLEKLMYYFPFYELGWR